MKTITSNVIGGVLGISFIVISFFHIWRQRYLKHGEWMLRSYAILMAIFTVYLLIGVFSLLGLDAEQGYSLAHLICFPVNLAIAELIIRRSSSEFFVRADRL